MFAPSDQYVRQCLPDASAPLRGVIVWLILALVTLLFVSAIFIAPVAEAHGHSSIALLIYASFGKFCHQIPERSFYVDGHPLAVCARCTGIYFGACLGVLSYPLVRPLNRTDPPARKWLILALAPTAVDFALGFFGILENTHWSRFLTGALLGGVTAFYVVPGLVDMSRIIFRRPSERLL